MAEIAPTKRDLPDQHSLAHTNNKSTEQKFKNSFADLHEPSPIQTQIYVLEHRNTI